MSQADTLERGSSKLFAIKPHDYEGLSHAIGLAQEDYEVKWWWWYGQPAFDRLRLTIEVDRAKLGNTVTRFMEQNGRDLQVTSELYPYGKAQAGRYRIELNIERQV